VDSSHTTTDIGALRGMKSLARANHFHKGQHDLKVVAVNHFQPFFEQNTSTNLQTQVWVARLFTHSVIGTKAHSLDRPCSLLEISVALKYFSKDKSPDHLGLDFCP
jgi:hypothetical protein